VGGSNRGSPQCQPTTVQKDNNLDRIEHAFYTSHTCVTARPKGRSFEIELKQNPYRHFLPVIPA
jgi:hypothetical protein